MTLLINKDGQQLGPYSLEEARALVLSGKLETSDWAWPDGATQWVHLKDVPGFSPTASNAKEDQPPPPPTIPTHEEQELWSGHPSQLLNFKVYAAWVVVLLAVLAGALISNWR